MEQAFITFICFLGLLALIGAGVFLAIIFKKDDDLDDGSELY